MSNLPERVWTEGKNGWVTRAPNDGDFKRRELLRSWQHGEQIMDAHTHQMRPMRYADVLREVQQNSLREFECAAEIA